MKDHEKIQVTIISVNIVIRKWIILNIEINNKYLRIKSINKTQLNCLFVSFLFSWFIACCILMIDMLNLILNLIFYHGVNLFSLMFYTNVWKHWESNILHSISQPSTSAGFIILKLLHRFGRSQKEGSYCEFLIKWKVIISADKNTINQILLFTKNQWK